MSKFDMRNHVDKLRRDGGKDSDYGDRSYHCPVCDAPNFKVNIKTGKWFSWSCDCASTEEGKGKLGKHYRQLNYQLQNLKKNLFMRIKMELL